MKFSGRISTCPTVPDLLREEAHRRIERSLRLVPMQVWCRPTTITAICLHRNDGIVHSGVDVSSQFRTMELLSPDVTLRARSRAIARSRRAAMRTDLVAKALHNWKRRAGINIFFAGASGTLAAARALNRCGLLTPDELGVAIAVSSRPTRAGMRLWRAGRATPET
jgi:hypothetical protein